MFAVVVTLKITPDKMDAFLPLAWANATASRQDEAGCHQFDVATDPARPGEVFLYELYTDGEAFAHHLTAPHFARFDQATQEMILQKNIVTYSQVQQ